ncbi:uncharacterized protein LOC112588923 [Harpegnathos saltator]|uniref:uncharacterized protein LOC112588923 n=1 Tax=Harpegnathos saltator TaxID=610380 RepID=UPI000DBEDED7|nr:uncharacterized protein LOC112588923 [Harpegnathos saltator]
MEERPKRIITKPTSYQTTSSDEAPPVYKRTAPVPNITAGSIKEDIKDIRPTLDKNANNDIHLFTNSTQNISSRTHAYNSTHITPTASVHPAQDTPNHTSHTTCIPHENEHLYYTNDTYTELQGTSRPWTTQRHTQHQFHQEHLSYEQYEERLPYGQHARITQKADNRENNDRWERMEKRLTKMASVASRSRVPNTDARRSSDSEGTTPPQRT